MSTPFFPVDPGTKEELLAWRELRAARDAYDSAALRYRIAQDRFAEASRNATAVRTQPVPHPTTQDAGSLDDAGAPLLIGNAGAIK